MNDLAADKIALSELMYRQAMALDSRDWQTYRSCLADEIDFDFSDHLESVASASVPRTATDPDAWTEAARISEGFDATLHRAFNLMHEVDGDYARSRCYMVNEHMIGDRSFTAAQLHFFDSIRTPTGWKLYKRRLKDIYGRGDSAILQMAVDRFANAGADK